MKSIHKVLALPLILLLVLSAACTPQQETNVVNTLNDVVAFANSLLGVAQTFGALTTTQEQSDIALATAYAKKLSQASTQAIDEWNSSDPTATKISVVTADLLSVPALPTLQTAKIQAAVNVLTASVNLLIGQLKGMSSGSTPVTAKALHAPRPAHFGFAGVLPGTLSHRLKSIRNQAVANSALADKILAVK